jgi:hypothetical protein
VGEGKYQVVDGACADCVDEVDDELDHEDSDEEGWHDCRALSWRKEYGRGAPGGE